MTAVSVGLLVLVLLVYLLGPSSAYHANATAWAREQLDAQPPEVARARLRKVAYLMRGDHYRTHGDELLARALRRTCLDAFCTWELPDGWRSRLANVVWVLIWPLWLSTAIRVHNQVRKRLLLDQERAGWLPAVNSPANPGPRGGTRLR